MYAKGIQLKMLYSTEKCFTAKETEKTIKLVKKIKTKERILKVP